MLRLPKVQGFSSRRNHKPQIWRLHACPPLADSSHPARKSWRPSTKNATTWSLEEAVGALLRHEERVACTEPKQSPLKARDWEAHVSMWGMSKPKRTQEISKTPTNKVQLCSQKGHLERRIHSRDASRSKSLWILRQGNCSLRLAEFQEKARCLRQEIEWHLRKESVQR